MLFPTLDDTAIIRSRDGFIRPSDVFENGETDLLCIPQNVKERTYFTFRAERVRIPYVMIRGTHGYAINTSNESMFIESRGLNGKKHLENIPAIKLGRKYGYIISRMYDLIRQGYEDNYYVNLSDYTLKKDGIYNIATEEFFQFLGWFVKAGTNKCKQAAIYIRTKNKSIEYYESILSKLNFEFINKKVGKNTTSYYFDSTWFVDLITALAEPAQPHHLVDEICLHCGPKLALAFRNGFVNCCEKDNYFRFKDRDRYAYQGDYQTMSDLSFIWNKAGYEVTTSYRYESGVVRMEEVGVPFYNYITEVKPYKLPKTMYQLIPVNKCYGALWVNGFRFRVIYGDKDN